MRRRPSRLAAALVRCRLVARLIFPNVCTAKAAPKATSSPKAGAKLSLKTATESQLQATAGITASQAQGLIAYRDKTGIASWDDVKKATRSDVAVTKLQACAKLK